MVRGQPRHVAAYAKEFLFSSEQLRQPVGALSGGERNRLALAVALAQPANLLVLDEPTNDLDMDTLDALEDMLAAYDGTVILVSHDRAFLDGVTTQIVGPLGRGRWVETPGGWADFEREYGGTAAAKPRSGHARSATRACSRRASNQAQLQGRAPRRRTRRADAQARRRNRALEASFADSGAFARDPKAFEAATARLAAARHEKDAAEAEWLEIEMRREALAKE